MYANAMGRMRIKSETQKARRPRSLCFQGISGTSPTSTMTRDTPLKQTRRPVSTRPFISPRLCFSSSYRYFFHFPPFSFLSSNNAERTFLPFRDIFFQQFQEFSLHSISSSSPLLHFRKFVYLSFSPSPRFKRLRARLPRMA